MTAINDAVGPLNFILHDFEGEAVGEAVVQVMNEGDLLVGLRPANGPRNKETAIVLAEGRADGSVQIKILTGEGDLLHEQVVQPRV